MKFYIFDSQSEAEAYDQQVVTTRGLPEGDNWANPIKHPSEEAWAIAFSPKVVIEGKQPVELSSEWYSN